jgi:hypothetical protein
MLAAQKKKKKKKKKQEEEVVCACAKATSRQCVSHVLVLPHSSSAANAAIYVVLLL